MASGLAQVPFFLKNTVVIVKGVPAEICQSCHEPFMTGIATDRITALLSQARAIQAEVLVLTYAELPEPMALAA